MPLQIDATLCYAKGGCPPVPTDADRKIDSPYNTYKVKGLPPTPIKTVSEVALRAALDPGAGAVQVLRVRREREDLLRDHAVGAREERGEGARCRLTTPSRRAVGLGPRFARRSSGPSSCTAPRPARAARCRTSRTCSRSRRWCSHDGGTESEAIAGLLHDAIEDARREAEADPQALRAQGGADREGVHRDHRRQAARRRRSAPRDASTWRARKQEAIDHLAATPTCRRRCCG